MRGGFGASLHSGAGPSFEPGVAPPLFGALTTPGPSSFGASTTDQRVLIRTPTERHPTAADIVIVNETAELKT